MSFTALLVAALVGLVLSGLAAGIAAVAWYPSMMRPGRPPHEREHHTHGVAVVAPRSPIYRSARRTTYRWAASVAGAGLGPPSRAVLHRLFRSAPCGTVVIGGDFDYDVDAAGSLTRKKSACSDCVLHKAVASSITI
jgi:hypothetical protein